MRAPVSWLAEYVDLPAGLAPRALADALIRTGSEVESVASGADALNGPIVVGRVLGFDEEPQKNGKTIRWCQLDVGEDDPRGIVCGAHNFAVGDLVVVSLPGAVLPGGFVIAARKTYGHVSDGMICSVRELGIGDEHDGILVLPTDSAAPGADPLAVLGLTDAVLDVAVTTDRGYCLSIRGLAREAAASLGVTFHDLAPVLPRADEPAYPVGVDDPAGCSVFSARAVRELDPSAATPDWMANRLRQCGMRSISLAVDVTNYVMLETGQPLHAFDRGKLRGAIGVRRATAGEKLETLDGTTRTLHPDDLVVTDDRGPIALAGVMGGASTEIGGATSEIVLEAAHWDPVSIARTVRRHRLPSEASKRFERDVDPQIAGVALERCVQLLIEHGGAVDAGGYTVVGRAADPTAIELSVELPERVAGMPIARQQVLDTLRAVGCRVEASSEDSVAVVPPSWRPDLLLPADLVEEVIRLVGYDRLPSVLPSAPAGRGLSERQKLLRTVSRAMASVGLVEVLSYPFAAPSIHDQLGLDADDQRRHAALLVNPLSEDEPELRTSLLPGLLGVVQRNLGRGNRDIAIFETGLVFLPRAATSAPPLPGLATRPSEGELSALTAVLPEQPRHVAAVLAGAAETRGWWGPGRDPDWADAVELARIVGRAARADLVVEAAQHAPWHPGRCAGFVLNGVVLGYAGELHPRVVGALGLPERTCAMELDLELLPEPLPAPGPTISSFPPVLLDLALVVDAWVPAAVVQRAVQDGAGELLEDVRLFDAYSGERIEAGRKSLAFALRFRAPDRTLTVQEATVARDAAVARAAENTGAQLRS